MMQISGKYVLVIIFTVAIGLGLFARQMALLPHASHKVVTKVESSVQKPRRGYRPKYFQTFEKARETAESKINPDSNHKNIITKYESKPEGWLFYFESLNYLNSGNAKDKIDGSNSILVRPDNTTEFIK